jgi:hypothetical protein
LGFTLELEVRSSKRVFYILSFYHSLRPINTI